MADYKRLVSYIYNYDSGIRQKNVGFSRVESKNGQCKVTIHITASISSQETLKVYLFRRTGSQMEGIYFGDMEVKNGAGDFKAETNTYALMESPYSLDDISGVLLLVNKGKFFGSQWDDEPILINNFMVFDAKKREEERVDRLVKDIHVEPQNIHEMIMEEELASSVNEPEESSYVQAADLDSQESLRDTVVSVMDSMEGSFQEESEISEEAETFEQQEPKEENFKEAEYSWENQEEKMVQSASVEEEKEISTEPITHRKQAVDEVVPARLEEREEEAEVKAEALGNSCCCSDNYPECVRQILKNYPSVKPFPSSSPDQWVRIEPKDIGMLPVETWILANNSFLLHGYYNYRHLVFGILPIGDNLQYVIGVPGVLQNTERTMAGMFGFHRFLSANNGDAEQGSFGYWIQQIVL